GLGVWRVELDGAGEPLVRVRHAARGAAEERVTIDEFCGRCAEYFAAAGGMLDQAYQPRLTEGMVRCYLVHGRVEGFGLQAVNALHPAALQPTQRLYHPPTLPGYQDLKQRLECEWVPELQRRLGIATSRLPVLWDCDFLLGPKTASGADSYVL